MTDIYALCDPDTGEIRYIGKANNAQSRFTSHLWYSTRRNTPVYCWIRKLAANGKVPSLRILEVVAHSEWQDAERRFIAQYRSPRLLNVSDGGDEPYCPPEVRSAIGRRNAAKYWTKEIRAANARANALALHSDPERRRWWHLVRSLATDLAQYERGIGKRSEAGHKKLVLNCMAMADLFPNKVPAGWRNVRWKYDRWGDLNLDIIKGHMNRSLFERLDFTGVYP